MDLQKLIAEVLNHLRGMWRYRWHMVLVTWLIAVPGWIFVSKMPNVYEASAKVLVDTNSLLPTLTKGLTATENVIDEVDIVSRAVPSTMVAAVSAVRAGLRSAAQTDGLPRVAPLGRQRIR